MSVLTDQDIARADHILKGEGTFDPVELRDLVAALYVSIR